MLKSIKLDYDFSFLILVKLFYPKNTSKIDIENIFVYPYFLATPPTTKKRS
jgi:hypothetical protein